MIDVVNHRNYWYDVGGGAWHFATYMDFDPSPTLIPFGGAGAHTLSESGNFSFTDTGLIATGLRWPKAA